MTYDRLEGYKEQIKILEGIFGVEAVGWEIIPDLTMVGEVFFVDTESNSWICALSRFSGYSLGSDGSEGLRIAVHIQKEILERPERYPLLYKKIMSSDPASNPIYKYSFMKTILRRNKMAEKMAKTDTERLDFMDRHEVEFSNDSTARVDIDAAMNRMGESELREAWDWFVKGVHLTVRRRCDLGGSWDVIFWTGKRDPTPGNLMVQGAEITVELSSDQPTRAEAVLIAYRNRVKITGEKK